VICEPDKQQVQLFPKPYPGEILYSMAARYHLLSAETNYRRTSMRLFGIPDAKINSALCGHIGAFYERIGKYLWDSPAEFIEQHTLFPLCRFLVVPGRSSEIMAAMIGEHGRSAKPLTSSGLSAVPARNNRGTLRFCVACRDEETIAYGTGVWTRAHQVPGVLHCARHGLLLVDSCPQCGGFAAPNVRWRPPPKRCECGYVFRTSRQDLPAEMRYSAFYDGLLACSPAHVPGADRLRAYRNRLAEQYLYPKTRTARDSLGKAFDRYYSVDSLGTDTRAWTLQRLSGHQVEQLVTRSPLVNRPGIRLTELFVLPWLFDGWCDFHQTVAKVTSSPASEKAKPVRRSNADIQNMVLATLEKGLSVSQVAKTCRVQYWYPLYLLDRLGRCNDLRMRAKRTLICRVVQRLRRGCSTTMIVRELQVTRAEIDAIRMAYPEAAAEGARQNTVSRLAKARNLVLRLLKTGNARSRQDLRRAACNTVDFLAREDGVWIRDTIREYCGVSVSRKRITRRSGQVDWPALDIELEGRIEAILARLELDPFHPRITLSLLARMLGFNNVWLYTRLMKMPKTHALLNERLETGQQGRDRRIRQAIWVLIAERGKAPTSEIKRLARVSSTKIVEVSA
jgi:hypothetical protein